VRHQPADDVEEAFGRVLQAIDVLDLLELDAAVRLTDREVRGERLVQPDVIAEEGVGAERHVLDPDEVHAVREMVHDRLQRVAWMGAGQGRVGCCLESEYPAALGTGLDDGIRLHAIGRPDLTGTAVGDEDRLGGFLDDIERGPVAGV
jgi:hypothetical protein